WVELAQPRLSRRLLHRRLDRHRSTVDAERRWARLRRCRRLLDRRATLRLALRHHCGVDRSHCCDGPIATGAAFDPWRGGGAGMVLCRGVDRRDLTIGGLGLVAACAQARICGRLAGFLSVSAGVLALGLAGILPRTQRYYIAEGETDLPVAAGE